VLELAAQQPAATRAQLATQQRALTLAILGVPLLLFVLFGGVRAGPRPDGLLLETAVGSSILTAGIAIVGLRRGGSMLGRPRPWLLSTVLLTPVLLFAWRALASSQYPNMMVEWHDRPGLRCLLVSSLLALAPVLGLLWMRRDSMPNHPRSSAAGVGAAVGAGTWVLVDLWCPVGYVPHVLLGHVLPLVLLIMLSALIGGRILRLKR
jgi:hypothetical protein